MKTVFNKGSHGRGTTIIAPGAEHRDVAAWHSQQSGSPLTFTVRFIDGMAEVDDQIAEYLIARNLAYPTPNH